MTLVEIKAVLDIVKVFTEVIALCLAGAWAIVGMIVFKQRQKAAADLRKVELESKQLELVSRRVALLSADIDASIHPTEQGNGFWIIAVVTLKNNGTRDTCINWQDEPPAFGIRRTGFNERGEPIFDDPVLVRVRKTRDPNRDAVSLIVRAANTEHLTFAVRVEEPGLYLLSFRGALDSEECKVAVTAGAHVGFPKAWTAMRYVVVQRPHEERRETTNT